MVVFPYQWVRRKELLLWAFHMINVIFCMREHVRHSETKLDGVMSNTEEWVLNDLLTSLIMRNCTHTQHKTLAHHAQTHTHTHTHTHTTDTTYAPIIHHNMLLKTTTHPQLFNHCYMHNIWTIHITLDQVQFPSSPAPSLNKPHIALLYPTYPTEDLQLTCQSHSYCTLLLLLPLTNVAGAGCTLSAASSSFMYVPDHSWRGLALQGAGVLVVWGRGIGTAGVCHLLVLISISVNGKGNSSLVA